MIANAKKRTKASEVSPVIERRDARMGGDRLTGNALDHAAQNTLADDRFRVTEVETVGQNSTLDDLARDSESRDVEQVADGQHPATELPSVGHDTPLGEGSSDNATNCAKQAAGNIAFDTDKPNASRKHKRRLGSRLFSKEEMNGSGNGGETMSAFDNVVASICRQLQELQRRKAATLKSRIMIDNQLAALVSTELGYHAGLEEADRKELRKQAEAIIKAINAGDESTTGNSAVECRVASIVQSTGIARDGFDLFLREIEKEMVKLARQLPVAEWCQLPDQRGLGLLSLATVIGETGDLSLYANPAKVWKRLGLAPYQGKMPSTWRRSGGLSAEQWTEVGYSPRRRSIMYVIGENIVKQNKSIYRQRYDETKANAAANHPDWNKQRCHYHGMLLSVKRLIRDLWKVWHSA